MAKKGDDAERARLLGAVIDAPDDDVPRLVFADWLAARGDARGEFIRVQCALAGRLDPGSRETLGARGRELLAKHGAEFAAAAKPAARTWALRRGFVDEVEGTAKTFLPAADALFAAEPVRRLSLGQVNAKLARELSTAPWLGRLFAVKLRGSVGDGGAQALADAEGLARVVRINLDGASIGAEGVAALAQSPNVAGCRTLGLTGNEIGDEGLEALARGASFAHLETLYCAAAGVGNGGLEALAASPHVRSLRVLCLGNNEAIGDDGVAALARSAAFAGLTRLELDGTSVGDAGASALAQSEHLGSLRKLAVRRTNVRGTAVGLLRQRFGAALEYGY